MRYILLLLAGALFSLSWFAFADGFVLAKEMGVPYNFLMWLPAIMIISGMFLLGFTDAKLITAPDSSLDDRRISGEKILFFIGVVLTLGGFAVSLWKAIDPYSNVINSWPGVSLVLQSVLLALCSGILFSARLQSNDEWM